MEKKSTRKKQNPYFIIWALVFVGILFILSFTGYSDGDDAFFYEYTNQMGFVEYLSWRYNTWVGRMAAEALVWFTFRRGIWFWRVVNAGVLAALPMGIWKLAERVAGSGWYGEKAELWQEKTRFGAMLLCFTGYLLMNAMTLGYAAVWVNGSIFYTWSFTCGILALIPVADAVHGKIKEHWCAYWYVIPCCIVASMSIEQMGAVLLTLEILACIALSWKKRKLPQILAIQTLITAVSFILLFLAPGNELRVAQETLNWMPQYDMLSLGEHFFITLQWLLSSFANENCAILCVLWVVAMFSLWEQKKKGWLLPAAMFFVTGLLKYMGVSLFCDMGMGAVDGSRQVLQVPRVTDLTAANVFAMLWWSAALIYTLLLLLVAAKEKVTLSLTYLAGIASEAIMYFSPTMYASGARVYYLTDLLYVFIISVLFLQLRERRNIVFWLVLALGILHFCTQISVFLAAAQS